MMQNKDLWAETTNKIVALLESGNAAPWQKPWLVAGEPKNVAAKRAYQGVNTVLLWAEQTVRGFDLPWWLTYNQAKAEGAHVRKGEKGSGIVFFKMRPVCGCPGRPHRANCPHPDVIPTIRGWSVFNVSQVEGLPAEWTTLAGLNKDAKPVEALEGLVTATKAKIGHGGDVAAYLPTDDRITLPNLERFARVGDYYATAFHELAHWTGPRLGRNLSGRFGDAAYAFEELVAELSAAFCCARCGVEGTALQNNAAYLGHWLRILRQDKHAIFTAARLAREATSYILKDTDKEEEAETEA